MKDSTKTKEDFFKEIKKVYGYQENKHSTGYRILDMYKYYKQECGDLTRDQFTKVIHTLHKLCIDTLLKGDVVTLPQNMGELEIKKRAPVVKFKDGKLITTRPIDWNKTLDLWYEDDEARKEKQLVRMEPNYVYLVCYNKGSAIFKNKCFTRFKPVRAVKLAIKDYLAENNKIDTQIIK